MIDPELAQDIAELGAAEGARITRPGQWRVRREGNQVKVEVFS